MGCVSSKFLKQQALLEYDDSWSRSRSAVIHPGKVYSHLSFDDYYPSSRDIKIPEQFNQKKNSSANEDYDYDLNKQTDFSKGSFEEGKHNLLESQIVKPSFGKSSSSDKPLSSKAVIETINVADIMQGLDDDVGGCEGTPASCDGNVQPTTYAELEHVFHQRVEIHSKYQQIGEQRLINHIQPCNSDGHGTYSPSGTNIASQTDAFRSTAVNGRRSPRFQHSQSDILEARRGSFLNVNQQQTVFSNESDLPQLIKLGTPPNIESPSNLMCSASSGRLKLTLNVEYENRFFTSSQDWSSPPGSSTRRSFINYVDVATEPNSPVFDPALLAYYEKFLTVLSKESWNLLRENEESINDFSRTSDMFGSNVVRTSRFSRSKSAGLLDPLEAFEMKCPPGGKGSVVLYTTTLRGIRKTYEDCNSLRDLLQSCGVSVDERDVSLHYNYRLELTEVMGAIVSVPRLFIKGRYVGGFDEVLKLHEDGMFCSLLAAIPRDLKVCSCSGCGGVRFIPCLQCSGSCKIVGEDNAVMQCPDCNENGLIQCPLCSC